MNQPDPINSSGSVRPQPIWMRGDAFDLPLPADATTLLQGGAAWLTRAFRASGAIAFDNQVLSIDRCEAFVGGGTGTKALLSLTFAKSDGLPTELFAKFSRNFDDPIMDRSKFHMRSEVQLALLSRSPGFPVAVPQCWFADFEAESGTGLLITSRIGFGQGAIERQYGKCLDHEMPAPLDHYRALIRTIARLAGGHKGGSLPAYVAEQFPFDREAVLTANLLTLSDQSRENRVARYAAFAAEFPQLLPDAIRTEAFLARFARGFALFQAHQDAVVRFLHAQSDFIALCHWNANVDNAWYWRDDAGELQCGLLDWGGVGQMHVAMTIWGCLSGAQGWLWEHHLDEMIDLFAAEFTGAGGPVLNQAELRRHLVLYVAMMGLRWLMDAPPRIRAEAPDLTNAADPLDPRILASETARVQLQMMTNFLMFWHSEDATGTLDSLFANAVCAPDGT